MEGQRGPRLVPRPVAGEIRYDRGEAVLRHVLVEHDEVVEHAHQRNTGGDRRFLVDRHARRAGKAGHLQHAAGLFRDGRAADSGDQTRNARRQKYANSPGHQRCLPPAAAHALLLAVASSGSYHLSDRNAYREASRAIEGSLAAASYYLNWCRLYLPAVPTAGLQRGSLIS